MTELRLIFLGTSSAVPTKDRGLTCIIIRRDGELMMFDAGEGAQVGLFKAGLRLNSRMSIFLTHLHGDHCVGLLGVLQTMSMTSRDKPLHLFGPPGIKGFVKSNMRYLRFGLSFPLHVHQVKEGTVLEAKDYRIRACRAEHFVPSYAYLLEEFPRPGVFHPEKAKALDVPKGVLWSRLQSGESVRLAGGRMIRPAEVLGSPRPGRKIGFSGDTRPTPKLREFFSGADLLIFDSTYGDDHSANAVENKHSTAREAAILARDAGVKLLVLSHFSSRYPDVTPLVAQAREVHANVVAAEDQMVLDVAYPAD